MINSIYGLLNNKNEENESEKIYTKYITFYIKNNLFAIKIEFIKEIIPVPIISEIPNESDYIIGAINLRNDIIPIVDLNKKFFKETTEIKNKNCIIILDINSKNFGIVVDVVQDICSIPDSCISKIDSVIPIPDKFLSYILKFNNKIIISLNCKKILDNINIT